MLLDIAEKLIDRCIQLLSVRSDRKQAKLREIIEPMIAAFEELHLAYLEAFEKAHHTIVEAQEPMAAAQEVARYLLEQSLFRSRARAQLFATRLTAGMHDEATELVHAIERYLDLASYWALQGSHQMEDNHRIIQIAESRAREPDQDEEGIAMRYHKTMLNMRMVVARNIFLSLRGKAGDDPVRFRNAKLEEMHRMIEALDASYAVVLTKYREVRQKLLGVK